MTLFAVSPSYISPIERESRKYSFKLQGYGSISNALAGINKTNASEIIGYLLIFQTLPENKDALKKLIYRMDLMSEMANKQGNAKRLVFAISESTGAEEFLRQCKTRNLEIYLFKFKILTDLYIRSELIGTILRSYLSPYGEEAPTTISSSNFKTRDTLLYRPVLIKDDFMVLEPVKYHDSLEQALIEDANLFALSTKSPIHHALRKFKIEKSLNPSKTSSTEVEGLLEATTSLKMRIHYEMLYRIISDNTG